MNVAKVGPTPKKLLKGRLLALFGCFRPSQPSQRASPPSADTSAGALTSCPKITADQSIPRPYASRYPKLVPGSQRDHTLSRISVSSEAADVFVSTRRRDKVTRDSNDGNHSFSTSHVGRVLHARGFTGLGPDVFTPVVVHSGPSQGEVSSIPTIMGETAVVQSTYSASPRDSRDSIAYLPTGDSVSDQSEAQLTGMTSTNLRRLQLSRTSPPAEPSDISGGSSCRIGSCSDAGHDNSLDDDDFSWPCAAASPHGKGRQVEAFLLLPQAVATAMDIAFPLPQIFSRSIHMTLPTLPLHAQRTSLVINPRDGSLASPPRELAHPAPSETPRVSDSRRAECVQRLLLASAAGLKPPCLPKCFPGAPFKSASFKCRSGESSSIGFGSSSSRTYLSSADCDTCSSVSRSVISSSRSLGGASSMDSYRKMNINMSTDRCSAVSYCLASPRAVKAVSSGGGMVVVRSGTSSASVTSGAVHSLGGSIPEVAEQCYSHRSSFVGGQMAPIPQMVARPAVTPESKRAWCSSTQSRRAVLTAAPGPNVKQQPHQNAPLPVKPITSTPRPMDSTVQQAVVSSPLQRLRQSVTVRHVDRAISSSSKLLPSSLSSQPLQQVKEQQIQRPPQMPFHATENCAVRQSTCHGHLEQPQQKPQVHASHRVSQHKQVWGGRGYAEIHGAGAALCRHACIRTRAWS